MGTSGGERVVWTDGGEGVVVGLVAVHEAWCVFVVICHIILITYPHYCGLVVVLSSHGVIVVPLFHVLTGMSSSHIVVVLLSHIVVACGCCIQ